MSDTKRIVCLANSRKISGRCIAGVEEHEKPLQWIRPVSSRDNQEVSEYERQYEDGSDPRVLDIIDIPLLGHRPDGYQRENWLLDPDHYWRKIDTADWYDLEEYAELSVPRMTLWPNGSSSADHMNNRVQLAEAGKETSSLKLVHVDALELRVFWSSGPYPKRRVQGRFGFSGEDYALSVTDPVIERAYRRKADGTYQLDECYLTISLGEPFHGFCYKLIAAVLEKP